MLPRVAIIYLCYGNEKHIRPVADAIAALTYPRDRLALYCIPNGSPDGVVKIITEEILPRTSKDLPSLTLLNDGVNHGFAGGNNQAIKLALEKGFDYVFIHNGDLTLAPDAIDTLVALAETNPQIGAVQCLVRYWHERNKVNVTGGAIHIAGYGFAKDNGKQMSELTVKNGDDITYASGAATLYRSSALQKVGLLEEGFFMYHEDLELGMRLRFAGYKNVICTEASAYHDYQFSRNPKKFAWMELYRWVVVLGYYKLPTLILFMPLLLAVEAGSWLLALKGKWLNAKFWALSEWFKPRTYRLIWAMRQRTTRLRVIKDRDFLALVTGKIEAQDVMSPLLDKYINPVVNGIFTFIRSLIRW